MATFEVMGKYINLILLTDDIFFDHTVNVNTQMKIKKGSESVLKQLENENYHVPYLMALLRKSGIREPTSRFQQTPPQPAQQQPHIPHGLCALSTHGPGAGQLWPGRIPGL